LIVLICFWMVLGAITGAVAQSKGRSFLGFFFYGFLLFPVAIIHALVMRSDLAVANASIPTDEARKCPACAEMIRKEATICRYCHTPLAGPVPAVVDAVGGEGPHDFMTASVPSDAEARARLS